MAGYATGNPPYGPFSVGEQSAPTAGTVVADTGALPNAGIYEVIVTIGSSVAGEVLVQRRNAANGANVGDVVGLGIPTGNQSGQYRFWYTIAAGERVRVVMDKNLGAGTLDASINAMQLS